MATEEELEQLEADLGRLVALAAGYEELSTVEDIEAYIGRILTAQGYRLRNGVWQQGDD